MTSEIYDTGAELRRLIAAGQISEDALEADSPWRTSPG